MPSDGADVAVPVAIVVCGDAGVACGRGPVVPVVLGVTSEVSVAWVSWWRFWLAVEFLQR